MDKTMGLIIYVLTALLAGDTCCGDGLGFRAEELLRDSQSQGAGEGPCMEKASVFQIGSTGNVGVLITRLGNCDRQFSVRETSWETADLGTTWRSVQDFGVALDPTRLGPHPLDPQTVYRIHDAHDLNFFLERTLDGGRTWRRVEARVNGTVEVLEHYTFLAYHPKDPSTIFVSGIVTGARKETGRSIPFGLYVSHDKGDTFSVLTGNIDRGRFAISRSRPETMYAGIFNKYLIKSDNAGATWELVGPWRRNAGNCQNLPGVRDQSNQNDAEQWLGDIVIDPREHRIVYVPSGDAIWKTADGGSTWCFVRPGNVSNAHVDSVVIAIKDSESAVFAGTDAGLFLSRDGGNKWVKVDFQRAGVRAQ